MKREKQMGEAPAVLWREEKKTLTLCGEPVLEETLAWPEFEGKGRAVRRNASSPPFFRAGILLGCRRIRL